MNFNQEFLRISFFSKLFEFELGYIVDILNTFSVLFRFTIKFFTDY